MVKQTSQQQKARVWFSVFWFLLPFTFLYTIFTIWPVLQGVWVSFHKWGLMGKQEWVSLANYQKLIGDRFFWQSLRNTAIFVILTVPLLIVTAFLLASLANRPIKIKRFFTGVLLSAEYSLCFCDFIYSYIYGLSLYGVFESAVPFIKNPSLYHRTNVADR